MKRSSFVDTYPKSTMYGNGGFTMSMSVKKKVSILHNVNFDLTTSGTFITVGSSTPSGMATGNRQEKRLEVSKL